MKAYIATKGSGTPLVLIPGLQGRWEYMREAGDALAQSFRVITFALAGEPASGLPFDAARGLDNYDAQLLVVLNQLGIERAVICGVSYGGIVAARFAAAHPERTEALVLVSTPGPIWQLKPRHRIYARAPWLFGPLFALEAPLRLRRELAVARPRPWAQLRFFLEVLRAFVRAPVSIGRMGRRARLITTLDLSDACRRITAPTLVVTGEAGLDYVVPVEGSSQYARLIASARGVVLERTGHQGVITQPETFAAVVRRFVEGRRHAAA